ncbi:MAG: wax ester/triacylglycerol synthase family O-acyltransferase [Frankiaceae bacterium]|nr:wax ester/triacylglycerol synthase family O-acyltransferase [Frankiaceae bacterium]MBV9870679.1 wax ester/triacylglycerol synthase family O-acyltransferase [Frankiaceae bacterium]
MSDQLSGMDSAFLSLETPESPMHVVGALLLDPSGGEGFSIDRLREVIEQRVPLMPPFCRRLVQVPLDLDRPYWHYDTSIDLSEHVVYTHLPAGDLHALADYVGEISSELLDRSKPLWQMHVVQGLDDGRIAIVAKVHHSTLYGAAGAEFIAELLDLSPEPQDKPVPEPADAGSPPSRATLAGRAVMAQAKAPVEVARLVGRAARSAPGTVKSIGDLISRRGRDALPPTAPDVPISGTPTARRSTAFGALSLDLIREVKTANGVTINDAVLATVALAMRRYLANREAVPAKPLVAGVPVNIGEGEAAGTNALTTMLVGLPMDIDDPAELIAAVHAESVKAKEFISVVGLNAVANLADLTVPAALNFVTWFTRSIGAASLQPTMLNLVVSNVMGPPIPLYLAGAQVDAIYPMGPLLTGAGMNITVLSNLDRLDVGIMACPDLVDDCWEIVNALPECLDELAKTLA